MEYKNLSNGETDGLALIYVKNKISYPVMITLEQAEMLDMMIGMAVSGKLIVDFNHPMGEVESLIK